MSLKGVAKVLPSKTYGIMNDRFVGHIDDLQAMEQAIGKILLTERYEWLIYTDNYGSEFASLIGESFDLAKSELSRIIQEALSVDDRITEVKEIEILPPNGDKLDVRCTVQTIFGEMKFRKEVML